MNSNSIVFVVIMLTMFIDIMTVAKDFGRRGHTFEVREEGFVKMLQRRLKDVNLEQHERKMQEIARKRIEEPSAIKGISRATRTTSYSFDPSYIVTEDIYLPCGKLLYPVGTSINPLEHMQWEGRIVFIDGRDSEQVVWARDSYIPLTMELVREEEENMVSRNKNSRIVLTGGRPLKLEEELGVPIYFDQFGELTTKFNIVHVPAIVEQDGKYLKVTEINIGKNR